MTRPEGAWRQRLPGGAARERLREKGQFWTPDWIADGMVSFALGDEGKEVFDPAAGSGAFFRAAQRLRAGVRLLGTEIAPEVLDGTLPAEVEIRDFVLDPPERRFEAIVANPPYIRHHRLGAETKARLRAFCTRFLGFPIDGRAGYHVYFLLRALERLAPDGRLAFILPADTFEGTFAPRLWRALTSRFRLHGVIAFAPDAAPFPNVDTNALIVLFRNQPPVSTLQWARCTQAGASDLLAAARRREISEALATGLSRAPAAAPPGPVLGDFCRVMRGVATGANDFFFLNSTQIAEHRLPPEHFLRAIGRTRDVAGHEVSRSDLDRLDQAGRPTYLLSVAGAPQDAALRKYLRQGETQGLPARPLISTRHPWYRMETRVPPPFLFAYLGRRSVRFLRNSAGVVPLTGFLCLYPHRTFARKLPALWQVLQSEETVANLAAVGKSYGQGAIKVEPRALERLPLPHSVLRAAGLAILSRSALFDA